MTLYLENKLFGCISACVGGPSMKLHISHFQRIRYRGDKFGFNQSISKGS